MKHDPSLPLSDTGTPTAVNTPAPGQTRPDLYHRFKLWRVPLLVAFLGAGALAGMYFEPPALRALLGVAGLETGTEGRPSVVEPALPPAATPEAPSNVTALGRLIPEGDVVRLAVPFGAGDARVARILVAEGELVETGQPIAELDSLPQYLAAVTAAQANVAAKEAALVQARAAVEAALAEAQANYDRAASITELTEEEAARQRDLFERGVSTQAALDRAEALSVQAARDLDRAAAQLARQRGGEAQPDVVLAARQLDVARADLALAESDLARGQVLAPQPGRILSLHVRVGEKPDTAGIATLGTTERMEAELEVYQTDIARVAHGLAVSLSSPALPAPLTGKVTRIGLEVERQSILSADPAANTDARIVRVTVALDAGSSERAAALTGLEVTGRIEVEAEP
ncbi:HlyD family efflux transporter periplasmic adaptor subunit [Tropicimonas marinistellae]|uniref:HlyD family efflux transporter periplasmic adaptor subunit n=1 Tax=Tropicimonas marinistellae TaxID=1739787 RepID=UPI00082A5DFD|nr:HlyD family efflux transporter periplasmic adaptor subunit [Tropicimonas marinistellae]